MPASLRKINIKEVVNRRPLIKKLCEGRSVLDIGCTAYPDTQHHQKRNQLLSPILKAVSKEYVGVDKYGDSIRLDIETESHPDKFDVVVLGEVIEHLSNPGNALDNIRGSLKSYSLLIVSTPNAASYLNMVYAASGQEYIHEDHVAIYSFNTLTTLLNRHGYAVKEVVGYAPNGWLPFIERPHLAPGLIAMARIK